MNSGVEQLAKIENTSFLLWGDVSLLYSIVIIALAIKWFLYLLASPPWAKILASFSILSMIGNCEWFEACKSKAISVSLSKNIGSLNGSPIPSVSLVVINL